MLKPGLFLIISCLPLYPEVATQARDAYAKLPLSFEENKGQTDPQVKYLTHGPGFILYLTGKEMVLAGPDSSRGTLRMRLEGANPNARLEPLDKLPGITNYFIGNDPSQWRTHIANYSKVAMRGVYPGIDLIVYGNQRQLEYDLAVAPGADPSRIRVKFDGAESMTEQSNGDLVIRGAGTEILQRKPVIYQMTGNERSLIDGHFTLRGRNRVGFEVARYDMRKPLVIDPSVMVGTYLGGSASDQANGIATNFTGIYITGSTNSANFPNNNAFHANFSGGAMDAFVTKLNQAGTTIVYSTYLGGTNTDSGQAIAVDAQGSAYVTGSTSSANFPLSVTVQSLYGGNSDVFITKVNPTGDGLTYSTYLGGIGQDRGTGIAIDGNLNAYITGSTTGSFPTVSALQPAFGGGTSDGFVVALNDKGDTLRYSTYLGGAGNDFSNAIASDSGGNVFLTGSTTGGFPTTGAFQPGFGGGGSDVFVTRLTSTGSLVYSTYLGGPGTDSGQGIAIDSNGNAYVTGSTSGSFPMSNPVQGFYGGGTSDAFISQLTAVGNLVFSTYLGGGGADSGNAIAVDLSGTMYLTGFTTSVNFPVVNALQTTASGAWIAKLTGSSHNYVYATYFGGGQTDSGTSITFDSSGLAYVAGYTTGGIFVQSAVQAAFGGGAFDAFVAIISDSSAPVCSFTLSPPSPVTFQVAGGPGGVGIAASFSNCAWSATSNIDWITNLTPFGTGSGTASYNVSANNTGVTRTGAISVAGQSYTIIQSGTVDNSAPFGFFDVPVSGTTNIVGAIPVSGWALDNIGVTKVEIYRDPVLNESTGNFGLVFIGTATFVPGARPDVAAMFPTFPNANRAGWGYQLLTNFLPNSGNGTFRLHAFAFDGSGNITELNQVGGSSGVVITCTNATAMKPFGTIDTPLQGDTIFGTNYVNFGWALTPQPFIIPIDGSTIFVVIDGVVQAGHPTYNQFRSDIATLFPNYQNSNGAVGFFRINTTLLANGLHSISWNVTDNGARAEGIGSRYFMVANGVTNQPEDGQSVMSAAANRIRPVGVEGGVVERKRAGDRNVSMRRNGLNAPLEHVAPNKEGIFEITVQQTERIELHLGAVHDGYLRLAHETQVLPLGSTLDPETGVFYWDIVSPFFGAFDLEFTADEAGAAPVRVRVTVAPKMFE
ncbi:MAG TPA: SBBP repeat-containing protein [Bryobacteraceae bacterium]